MLYVLRNIRQKLIKDNKVTSYLLYAIGEILLVVIGILIAVSIDDNQKEKQQLELKNWYLTSIQSEIRKNLDILNEMDSLGSLDTLYIQKANNKIIKNDGNVDSLKNSIETNEGNLVAYRDLSIPTLETLYLSGNLELFTEDQRKLLLELRSRKNTYSEINVLALSFVNNAYQKFWDEYGFEVNQKTFGPEFEKIIWDFKDDRQLIIRVKNVLNTRYNFQTVGFSIRQDYRNAMTSFIANTN